MDALLALLAVLGGAALVLRLARALLRILFSSAESAAAAGLAEVRARRGDLSGLAERKTVEHAARGARRRQALVAVLWLLLLVLPPFAGWTGEVYAAASILWLLPLVPIRRPPHPPRGS